MSSYPPPPPPGQYPPVFDPRTAKAQRRLLRAQAKAQQAQQRAVRQQMRAQRRSMRRGSIVGPLIILLIGIVFLLAETGRLSWAHSFEWYGRWWPAVLIAAGLLLLLEWSVDQRFGRNPGGTRVVGGGVVFLLVVLTIVGLSSRPVEYGMAWGDNTFGHGYGRLDHLFGDRHDGDSSMNSAMAGASSLVIRNPHGDVTVSGESDDGQVHVSIHTQTYGWKESDVDRKAKELQPTFSSEQGVLTLNVKSVDGGEADLTIEMPHTAPVTIQADRGDVTVSEMAAPVTVSANHGDVDISGVAGPVTMHTNDDDSSITLHSVQGPVSLEGHSGDIDISDVAGDLTLQGDFFGSTDLEHIQGAIHFTTSRTQFSAARLDDEFSVDRDSLDANELLGPVVLKSQDKNVTLDRVQGSVDVTNQNGSVELTSAAPLAGISIENRHGSVDVGLPGGVGFALDAQTQNGDIENDFNLSPQEANEVHTLKGSVAGGGPTVTIETTDGDVTVRRSIVAPLPPAPPASPKFTRVPSSRIPRVPKVPKTLSAPPPPVSPTI
ncbi:MAG: DUF4097 family beta strand repeat-containing protein [Acidobacteriaceae bacterium]